MAERSKRDAAPTVLPRTRSFGTAALSARQQFSWIWSRESLLRIGLALVLAVALWLYITRQSDRTIAFDYSQPLPVSTVNVRNDLTVTNNLGTIRVRIRLANRNMQVMPANFRAFVDLTRLKPGRSPHVPVQVVADPGIQVTQVTPPTVPVVLEPIQQKHVPVRYHILTPPPYGYNAPTVRIQPSTVTVSGARSFVSQVTQAAVYINLAQARSSVNGTYKPWPENSRGDAVSDRVALDPAQVNVDVPVNALSSYKTLPILVRISGQPKPGVGLSSITVSPAEITASGSPARLSRISTVSTSTISVSRWGSGTLATRAWLRLPKGVHSRTRSVRVRAMLAPVAASSSVEIGVAPTNLPAGLVAHIRPARVLVTIVGYAAAVRTAARHMHATVDLAGYSAGTYQLTPRLVAPPGLKKAGPIYPGTVTVIVTSS